ncbi:MAG: hypothetical protein M1454_02460 [Candidatus Thermoplasmatota archaeon]|nr:hypothetical protein [Candidatus Thermoplasmatota archaeon]MCL5731459.1 hypothetical protein [Candidatus Thermoplasmatota archaeon]
MNNLLSFQKYRAEAWRAIRRHMVVSSVYSALKPLNIKGFSLDLTDGEYLFTIPLADGVHSVLMGFRGFKDHFKLYPDRGDIPVTLAGDSERDLNSADVVVSPYNGTISFDNSRNRDVLSNIFGNISFLFPNFPAPFFRDLHPLIKAHFLVRYMLPGKDRSIPEIVEDAVGFSLAYFIQGDPQAVRSDFYILIRDMISSGVIIGDSTRAVGPKSIASFERKYLRWMFRREMSESFKTLFDYERL